MGYSTEAEKDLSMNRKLTVPALIMAAGVATAGSLVYARSWSADDDAIADLAKAKITLIQAVVVAEAHASGKATEAELESEHGTVVYEVEVVTTDNKVFEIKVDAADGKVLSSKQAQSDRGEKDDDED